MTRVMLVKKCKKVYFSSAWAYPIPGRDGTVGVKEVAYLKGIVQRTGR